MPILKDHILFKLKNNIISYKDIGISFNLIGDFKNPLKKVISLNAFANTYALGICNTSFLNQIDISYIEDTLDDDLILALFENYFKSYKDNLASLLQENIDIIGYIDKDEVQSFEYKLNFNYIDNKRCKHQFILYIKDYNALVCLYNVLENIKIKPVLKNTTLPLIEAKVVIATVCLSIDDIEKLSNKDAILLDNNLIKDKKVYITFNNVEALAHLDGINIILDENLHSIKEVSMSDENLTLNDELCDLKDIKVQASVILDRLKLSIDDISKVTKGSTFVLNNDILSNLSLEIYGQSIAKGRIVEIDDNLAFVVTKVKEKASS